MRSGESPFMSGGVLVNRLALTDNKGGTKTLGARPLGLPRAGPWGWVCRIESTGRFGGCPWRYLVTGLVTGHGPVMGQRLWGHVSEAMGWFDE